MQYKAIVKQILKELIEAEELIITENAIYIDGKEM